MISTITLTSNKYSKGKQTNTRASGQKEANRERGEQKRGEEKPKVFENHIRSGGEENERPMANYVIRGRRVYDGYVVCLDLA